MSVPMCTPLTESDLQREAMAVLTHLSSLELMLALRRDALAEAGDGTDRYESAKQALACADEARSSIETALQLSDGATALRKEPVG